MSIRSSPWKRIARHNQLLRFSSNGQPLERSQVPHPSLLLRRVGITSVPHSSHPCVGLSGVVEKLSSATSHSERTNTLSFRASAARKSRNPRFHFPDHDNTGAPCLALETWDISKPGQFSNPGDRVVPTLTISSVHRAGYNPRQRCRSSMLCPCCWKWRMTAP